MARCAATRVGSLKIRATPLINRFVYWLANLLYYMVFFRSRLLIVMTIVIVKKSKLLCSNCILLSFFLSMHDCWAAKRLDAKCCNLDTILLWLLSSTILIIFIFFSLFLILEPFLRIYYMLIFTGDVLLYKKIQIILSLFNIFFF